VLDFESEVANPYINGQYADTSSASRVDDKSHPFYEKWKINIPHGIKGDTFKNLKV